MQPLHSGAEDMISREGMTADLLDRSHRRRNLRSNMPPLQPHVVDFGPFQLVRL